MNCIKNNRIKKVFILFAVVAMVLSCGGNGRNNDSSGNDVNGGSGAKISIGEKFIGTGVLVKEIIGEVLIEITETQVPA